MDTGLLLLNIGFFLNFIALAFREILWIRILLTCGYFLRFITQYIYQDKINASIWMIVFVLVNLFQIIQILNERRRRHIEPKIVDLFETVFSSLTSYEFLTFWKKGIIKTVQSNTTIIKDGEQQFSIMLLLHGEVNVLKDNWSDKIGVSQNLHEMGGTHRQSKMLIEIDYRYVQGIQFKNDDQSFIDMLKQISIYSFIVTSGFLLIQFF